MPRLDIERQRKLEPLRVSFAKEKIEKLGYVVVQVSPTELRFMYKGSVVCFFPYSGWHSGKSIIDGRGIKKLLNQIK